MYSLNMNTWNIGFKSANIYLFKVSNRNTGKRSEICSKLTIKTLERRQWRHSGVFIVNFEDISHLFFSVSIVDFEQANVSWEIMKLLFHVNEAFPENVFGNVLRKITDIAKILIEYVASVLIFMQPLKIFTLKSFIPLRSTKCTVKGTTFSKLLKYLFRWILYTYRSNHSQVF